MQKAASDWMRPRRLRTNPVSILVSAALNGYHPSQEPAMMDAIAANNEAEQ
ncbi:MAG: hypothetical protein AB8C46_22905 [Burkholderiaceae bacterium]